MRRSLFPIAVAVMLAPLALQAKPAWVKKAQDLGLTEIQNCQSCHAAKPPALGDLGKWLVEQKKTRKAKDIDLNWVKEYKKPA